MYEVGRLYVWRNQVGYMAQYNDTVCQVTGPRVRTRCVDTGRTCDAWPTDSPSRVVGATVYAEAGDLRPIDPPSGERTVMDQFRNHHPGDLVQLDEATVQRLRDEEFFRRNGRFPCVIVPVQHA